MSDQAINPTTLHGINPNSPYLQLFVNIFFLTSPTANVSSKVEGALKVPSLVVSDTEQNDNRTNEKEEGEIDDNEPPEAVKSKSSMVNGSPKFVTGKIRKHRKDSFLNVKQLSTVNSVKSNGDGHKIKDSRRSLNLQAQIDLDNNPVRLHWLQQLLLYA